MRFMKGQRLALVSPWVLAAACALLALIIGVFAVNNYRREKSLMIDVLLERGATLIRFVTSGSRASFLDGLKNGLPPVWKWSEKMQEILEHAADHPGVHFLVLADASGKILAGSMPEKVGTRIDDDVLSFIGTIAQGINDPGRIRYRISGSGDTAAFQVAALFVPVGRRQLEQQGGRLQGLHRGGEGAGAGVGRLAGSRLCPLEWSDELERVSRQKYILLVELDLAEFNKAVRQQFLQIVILSVVLLLVGIGGWLSLLTLQGLKGSQNRLSRIKAFRDTLISSLPVGLIVTDSQGKIVLCNQSAEQIASVSESEVVGLPSEEVLAPELASALKLDLGDQQMRPAGSVQREIVLPDNKGVMRTLQLNSLSVVDNDGVPTGVMLLIQDLSQVKSLEEELHRNERMAALGKMAAGVAHELRNPLSSIKGLAILLRSRFQEVAPAPSVAPATLEHPCTSVAPAPSLAPATPGHPSPAKNSDQETADILVQEVERLNRSIGELLDYARPHKLIKEDVHPKELVQKAVSLIRMDAESLGVRVEVEAEDDLPVVVADHDKLNQVFLNLFLNSIQAMEGGGQLTIRLAIRGQNVLFTVRDTGCGVKKEDLPRVFDPYFTTKPEGTGLGLALSLKIIEEHGGTITFESEPDVGTTVVVSLPCM